MSLSSAITTGVRVGRDARQHPHSFHRRNQAQTLKGGLLQPIEWLRKTGPIDVRGRQGVSTTLIDALIEERPSLDRDRLSTERADDILLTILDPLAIIDTDTFRWGDPPNTYSVKKIDGVIKDETTGTRYASEVTVIR